MSRMIWIIDDDADTVDLMQIILQGQAYSVRKFTTAKAFLEETQGLPDLYIIDKWFDNVDGLKICKQLKTDDRTRHVPVIMVSAVYGNEALAFEHCADGAIAKPFEVKKLLDMVSKVFTSSDAVM